MTHIKTASTIEFKTQNSHYVFFWVPGAPEGVLVCKTGTFAHKSAIVLPVESVRDLCWTGERLEIEDPGARALLDSVPHMRGTAARLIFQSTTIIWTDRPEDKAKRVTREQLVANVRDAVVRGAHQPA